MSKGNETWEKICTDTDRSEAAQAIYKEYHQTGMLRQRKVNFKNRSLQNNSSNKLVLAWRKVKAGFGLEGQGYF